MYQSSLHRKSNECLSLTTSSVYKYGSWTRGKQGSLSASRISFRVNLKNLTQGLARSWYSHLHSDEREKKIRARPTALGWLQNRELLCCGQRRDERGRARHMRTSAYREEDWAKLFQPEAMNREELKEYVNEEPLWLWVFKSWHSGIKGALQFLWAQPGQIKHIEWPTFKSTVKMALLTLVVVMLLIVFLSTVDSLFRHLLTSSMRQLR